MIPPRARYEAADGIAILVLGIVALTASFTFRDYGLGWDDYAHSQYGDLLLAFYASGFSDKRALSFVNLFMYGGGFDMAAALAAKVLPFDVFETRRLAGAAIGIIGLIATWRIARRLGGPLSGLLALMLLAACPDYYGHMFMNAKDTPFAVAMAILLLGLVRGCEEYPKLSPATGAILIAGFSLSIGTRILGTLGGFYGMAAVCMIFIIEARTSGLPHAATRLKHFILLLVPVALLSYAVMGFVWPWSIVDPLNPFRALSYFSAFFEKPWREIFNGVSLMDYDMPRSYLPTLLALKLPEIMLWLAIGGASAAIVSVGERTLPAQRRAAFLAVLLAAMLPIAVTVIQRPAMYNGIRHFIFLLPPLAVLGGIAGAWLIWQARTFGRTAMVACVVVFTAGFAAPVTEMVRLHPYQYVHFNYIAGGIRNNDERYMLDYWGLSFKQASQEFLAWLAARNETPPAGRQWKIAVCGPHPPAQVALGPRFMPTWEPWGADFALMLGEYYCAQFDAPIVVEITREGVVFARVYDIRGRSIQNMFTIPPVR
jgi:hypothetical protein